MPRTNQPSKTAAKPRKAAPATKHGHGIPRETVAKYVVPKQPSIEDIAAARVRRYTMDHKRTDKDIVIAVLATVIVTYAFFKLTSWMYGA